MCKSLISKNIYKRVCRDRLVFRASARCRVRLMLETTPRFRLSWASERDSATPRQTCPKSRSESWQPRTDSSRTLSSFRLSQMSWTSAADSSSPVIWMEAGSILDWEDWNTWTSTVKKHLKCHLGLILCWVSNSCKLNPFNLGYKGGAKELSCSQPPGHRSSVASADHYKNKLMKLLRKHKSSAVSKKFTNRN